MKSWIKSLLILIVKKLLKLYKKVIYKILLYNSYYMSQKTSLLPILVKNNKHLTYSLFLSKINFFRSDFTSPVYVFQSSYIIIVINIYILLKLTMPPVMRIKNATSIFLIRLITYLHYKLRRILHYVKNSNRRCNRCVLWA